MTLLPLPQGMDMVKVTLCIMKVAAVRSTSEVDNGGSLRTRFLQFLLCKIYKNIFRPRTVRDRSYVGVCSGSAAALKFEAQKTLKNANFAPGAVGRCAARPRHRLAFKCNLTCQTLALCKWMLGLSSIYFWFFIRLASSSLKFV